MTATVEVEVEATEDAAEEAVRPGESKNDRFKRIVTLRANRILKDMELLLNTANRNGGYEYTPEQADEVINKLQAAVDALAAAYAGGAGEKLRVEL